MSAIRLPPRFIQDCEESGLDVGTYASGKLTASPAQIADLRNRAQHYAHADGPDQAPRGLKRAAQALLAALDRAP